MGTNYYVQTPACAGACEHCAQSERVHLGKSSVGWKFLHAAQEGWTPQDAHRRWLELAASGPVTDGYGDTVDLADLLDFIGRKQENPRNKRSADEGYGYFLSDDGYDFCDRIFS